MIGCCPGIGMVGMVRGIAVAGGASPELRRIARRRILGLHVAAGARVLAGSARQTAHRQAVLGRQLGLALHGQGGVVVLGQGGGGGGGH